MSLSEFTLLLQILLSAPSVALIVFVVALWLFRADFRALMRRIATLRFPGGEITTSQALRAEEPPAADNAQPLGATPAPDLPQNLHLTPEAQTRVLELFQAERARAYLWEYRYLNMFLVRHTQQVLDWLVGLPQRTTFQMFDAFWAPAIPTAQERKAVIGALETHHLIQFEGDLIDVTPKGREYSQWRGPLPSVAA